MKRLVVLVVGLCLVAICLATVIVSTTTKKGSQPRHAAVLVSEVRAPLGETGSVSVQLFCVDPSYLEAENSQRPVPQYAPGAPIWLQIRFTNESSEELFLMEPLERAFVSDDEPSARIVWWPLEESLFNQTMNLSKRFSRYPFLTELGRRYAVRIGEPAPRTRLSPGASLVRKVCFSNLYDVNPSWREYKIISQPFRLERGAGTSVQLSCGEWWFHVTGEAPGSSDTVIMEL